MRARERARMCAFVWVKFRTGGKGGKPKWSGNGGGGACVRSEGGATANRVERGGFRV